MPTTYIYCPRPSNGALELVRELGLTRLRQFDGMDFWKRTVTAEGRRRSTRIAFKPGDAIICWGSFVPEIDGVRVLNSSSKINKEQELNKLSGHVPVPQAYPSHLRPQLAGRTDFLRRSHWHQGGSDLLEGLRFPDFYVQKIDFSREFRLHSFNGASIRAGEKVIRDGFTLATESEWKPNANLAHPWIRSFEGGWRIKYDEFQSTAPLRKLAKAAVAALGLTFGAVDIGQTSQGTFYVLEVNRSPGIEGTSIQSYARAIKKWLAGEAEVKE